MSGSQPPTPDRGEERKPNVLDEVFEDIKALFSPKTYIPGPAPRVEQPRDHVPMPQTPHAPARAADPAVGPGLDMSVNPPASPPSRRSVALPSHGQTVSPEVQETESTPPREAVPLPPVLPQRPAPPPAGPSAPRGTVDLHQLAAPSTDPRPTQPGPPHDERPVPAGTVAESPPAPTQPPVPRQQIEVSMPVGGRPQAKARSSSLFVPPPELVSGVHPRAGTLVGHPDKPQYRPDIELDGADLKSVHVRAASLRGDDHRYNTEIRQDSMRVAVVDGVEGRRALLLAVADGVGSHDDSHIGSRETCQELVGLIRPYVTALLTNEGSALERQVRKLIDEIVAMLRDVAGNVGVLPVSLSTTLAAAIIDDGPSASGARRAVVFGVGDSPAYLLRDGVFRPIHDSEAAASIASTKTDALPDNFDSVLVQEIDLLDNDALLLCTDGLGNPLRMNQSVQDQLAEWWRSVPTVLEFGWQLSFRARSFGDDRTAICAWVR